ncbi:hypothetical protein PRIPAC_88060 [Pristionchus pacificus]|uniref:Uncharacterized protein n=1 Tax=Pristionchus pacificus TaxID=54126 RepID=A0A2A6CWJ6_PRIPA|nr:hypothetical protein PRIPAC_88060 [Pristionchus pacificus]|eukprot:PDM82456.1 hypothetical protein PRIPAC_36849 [Pristionchus pacificus]
MAAVAPPPSRKSDHTTADSSAVSPSPQPHKEHTSDLIEHSIRTLLSAPRDRALQLTLRISNGCLSTSLRAIDEEEILERAKNRGVVQMVKRSRDVKKVRDACDVARQYFFEVATHPNGGERDSDAILRDETRRRRRGRKVEVDIEEKESWLAWVSRRILGVTSRSNP